MSASIIEFSLLPKHLLLSFFLLLHPNSSPNKSTWTTASYLIGIAGVNQSDAIYDWTNNIDAAQRCAKSATDLLFGQNQVLFKAPLRRQDQVTDQETIPILQDVCQTTKIYYDFSRAVTAGVQLLSVPGISAIIGSPCTQEFLSQAALAAFVNPSDPRTVPIFTGGARLGLHIDQFPNAYRLSYSTATQWDMFFRMCKDYGWIHMAAVFDMDDQESVGIKNDLSTLARSQHSLIVSLVGVTTDCDWKKNLTAATAKARVLILLTKPDKVRKIMLAAKDLSMVSGGYAFFVFDRFGDDLVFNRLGYIYADNNDAAVALAYRALHVFVLRRLQQKIPSCDAIPKPNYWQITHYNAVLVAAYILTQMTNSLSTLPAGETFKSYFVYKQNMDFSSLKIDPPIYLNANGDLSEPMDLYEFNPTTNTFELVGGYQWIRLPNGTVSEPLTFQRTLMWGTSNVVPVDQPPCGFAGENCTDSASDAATKTAIGVSVVTGVIIIVVSTVYIIRHQKKAAKTYQIYMVHWNDVVVPSHSDEKDPKLRDTETTTPAAEESPSKADILAVKSVAADDAAKYEKILPYGVYWNRKLFMARMSSKYRMQMSRRTQDEILRVAKLKHENLAKFEGMCLEADHVCVLYEYCAKGTLQDLLLDVQHKLDWTIRFSLMNDIVKALAYIHPSPLLVCHGRLSSTCGFIDSRYCLKVADYGLNSSFELDVAEQWAKKRDINYYTYMLWSAPEYIRQDGYLADLAAPPKPPAKAGDIYSFGIILQEVILRIPPFGMYGAMTSEDMVFEIKRPNTGKDEQDPPFRPIIPDESANPGLIELARKCWAQNPGERPSIKQIKIAMKILGKALGFGEKGTILDSLLDQMDELMSNLQTIIEERGRILLEDKTRSETLLYQLLPREIADKMKKEDHISPESFESCTIMIFCIENFAKIVADCSVLQMTDLVLDFHKYLEDCMSRYDCVKIDFHDSIGTVASGLPRENGITHASEIAKLAIHMQCSVTRFEPTHAIGDSRIVCKLAIGINSGSCVSGVIGDILPRYCLFGETVQIAFRMLETANERYAQCTGATKTLLDSDFELVQHGEIFVKGKGTIVGYSIRGVIGDPELEILQHRYHADGGKMRHRQVSYV